MNSTENLDKEISLCTPAVKMFPPTWIFGVKLFIAIVIISENLIVFIAIFQNWKTLMRQHNLYRFVMSLVAADLLNGSILFVHSVFWIIASKNEINFHNENTMEVLRNLITGVIHGLTFASLASAALLNLVLRVTSTRALARAAAIQSRSQSCLRGISWVRNPSITIGIILLIWMVTLIFVVIPLGDHCESGYQQCINVTSPIKECFIMRNNSTISSTEDCNCSILNTPSKRSYILALDIFIALAWVLMLICNFFTTCIKTEVRKCTNVGDGRPGLKLVHSFGLSKDSSSFFAMVITLNLTLATIPYVIFTLITEKGSPSTRIYYGLNISMLAVEAVVLTTYISSIVNPFIYTAMLNRLRSDVLRVLKWRNHHKHKQQLNKEKHKEEPMNEKK